jgi:hypothetical protein
MQKILLAATAILLIACSSGQKSPLFETTGVNQPEQSCQIDPRSFAKAEPVADFSEGNGCGMRNAFRLYEVDGIKLSQPALVTCNVANTFHNWLQQTVEPKASQVYGARMTEIKIAASYSCRPRNNVRGAKLSEHGMGNAIDVAGFTFDNGKQITIERDYYGSSADRKFLSSIRSEACGPFHTVLGPGSDSHHKDHLHLDLQRERGGGPYCR